MLICYVFDNGTWCWQLRSILQQKAFQHSFASTIIALECSIAVNCTAPHCRRRSWRHRSFFFFFRQPRSYGLWFNSLPHHVVWSLDKTLHDVYLLFGGTQTAAKRVRTHCARYKHLELPHVTGGQRWKKTKNKNTNEVTMMFNWCCCFCSRCKNRRSCSVICLWFDEVTLGGEDPAISRNWTQRWHCHELITDQPMFWIAS